MKTMVNQNGVLEVTGKDTLLSLIERHLPYTTISIIGEAGTGKTTLMESLKSIDSLGIDEIIIFRLQGLSSEDFRIPTIEKKTIEVEGVLKEDKSIEFVNVGIFKKIIDNPDKKFLLVLDEITRGERDVTPLLFSILEGKLMDGIKRDNLYIITAFNDGDDYIMNFNFDDPALRRRQIFLQYNPTKQDFIDFITKNNYSKTIIELADYLNMEHIINHTVTKNKEQTTTFGSWSIFNNVIKDLEKKENKPISYESLREEVLILGSLYFNDFTVQKMVETLTVLENLNSIDIQSQIINNLGLIHGNTIYDKNGNVYSKTGKEKALAIRTMHFIKKSVLDNYDYFSKNGINILKNFEHEQALLLTLISALKKEIESMKLSSLEKEKIYSKVFQDFIINLNTLIKTNPTEFKPLLDELKTVYDLMIR